MPVHFSGSDTAIPRRPVSLTEPPLVVRGLLQPLFLSATDSWLLTATAGRCLTDLDREICHRRPLSSAVVLDLISHYHLSIGWMADSVL